MFKRDDIANLRNILWAIEKIEKSIDSISTRHDLELNEEKFDSVIVKLLNIGESAANLSEELKVKYPNTDWSGMYKMRNIIAHSYHSIQSRIVWDIIKNELPGDKKKIAEIFNEISAIKSNTNKNNKPESNENSGMPF